MCGPSGTCQTKSGSGILVDASSQLTSISRDIYGIAFADDESAKVTTLNRSGGDSAETYNWQKDITGKAAWWNCANYAGGGSPSDADKFVQANKSKNLNTLMTIPITGWVANVATSSDSTSSSLLGQPLSFCNYPQKADGTLVPSLTCCQAINTQESVLVDNGSKNLDTSFMGNWVSHLASTFGRREVLPARQRTRQLAEQPPGHLPGVVSPGNWLYGLRSTHHVRQRGGRVAGR
jgi:hypothetical protein